MTTQIAAYPLLLTLAAIVLLNSALTSAEKQEPYGTVNKFCSNNKNTAFCTTVLKADRRSATAKDNTALLLISADLAIRKLSKTRNYLAISQKENLKECVDAYKWGIGELQIIPAELKDDPATASYDALMASDAMFQCKGSLEKHQISDPYVLKMHGIDRAYVQLTVDISQTVG